MSEDSDIGSRESIAQLAESSTEVSEVRDAAVDFFSPCLLFQILSKLDSNDLLDPTDYRSARQQGEAFERAVLESLGPAEPELIETESVIPMRDGYKHPLRITKPAHPPEGGSPLVICFHGGGFMAGTIYNVAPYARGIAKLFGAVVVAPTYRLAPEHAFPCGILDAWDAVKWIAAHASDFSSTPSKGFILSGGSAGANFVCVLAEVAKSEKLEPPLTGLWSCIPVLFTEDQESRDTIPQRYQEVWFSREQVEDTPILTNKSARLLLEYYKPDVTSALWSPFNAESPFKDLPPTFVQVCGRDIIRDDGLIYERMLRDSGTKTRLNVYQGLPHCFWAFFPGYKGSKEFMVDVALGFAWLLNKDVELADAEKAMIFPQLQVP